VLEHKKGLAAYLANFPFEGYEIHMGKTLLKGEGRNFSLIKREGEGEKLPDGAVDETGNIIGTYVHGIFESGEFTKRFMNFLYERKGLKKSEVNIDFKKFKEEQFNSWAEILRQSLNMAEIYKIMGF